MDHNKLENSEGDGNTRPPDLPLEKLYAGQEATVRTGHGTIDWFQIGKGVLQGCILSPAYLTYVQSTSWEMLGWRKGSTGWNQDCREKYQSPQIRRWHHPYGRKWRTKEPLDESEREDGKFGLKLNIQKTKIMASGPITSWQIDGETVADFIFGSSKITADGDCSHEIKRHSLEAKLWLT